MLAPNVLDSEVVNTESKGDRPKVMAPKSWGDEALTISVGVKALLKEFLRKDACLG